jgi:hypothetical protein
LRWLGSLLIKGLFDGEHIFELEALSDGKTHFIHREEFFGVYVPILWWKFAPLTLRGFQAMNQELKSRAEARSRL